MPRTTRYELGFNWASDRDNAFTSAIAECARRRRISVLRVGRQELEQVRHRVGRGRLRVGLFLNTQGDGTRMESPPMLLCRALKARGCLVVEDPDDSKIYSDRAMALEYLGRAGLRVCRNVVIESWQPGRRMLSARQRGVLGWEWVAVPGFGLDRRPEIESTSRTVSAALSRGGFRPGQKILLYRMPEPAVEDERELRFRAWHLFGRVLPAWRRPGRSVFERVRADHAGREALSGLAAVARTAARITGLDWFMMEVVATGSRRKRELVVVEPPNALAGLGPGAAPLAETGPDVLRAMAEILVEAAWRRARGLPPPDGTAVLLA